MKQTYETTRWRFHVEPGVSVRAEQTRRMPTLATVVSLPLLALAISLLVEGLLSVMLPLPVAVAIAVTIGLSGWATVLMHRKAHVVTFNPLQLTEMRRWPWGWRPAGFALPLDTVHVVMEVKGDVRAPNRLVHRVVLQGEGVRRTFCEEVDLHRRFMSEVASWLGAGLGCTVTETVEEGAGLRLIDAATPETPRPGRVESEGSEHHHLDGFTSKTVGCATVVLGVVFCGYTVGLAMPDAYRSEGLWAVLVLAGLCLIPGLFIFIGVRLLQTWTATLDFDKRVVTGRLAGSSGRGTHELAFDSPGAHLVVHAPRAFTGVVRRLGTGAHGRLARRLEAVADEHLQSTGEYLATAEERFAAHLCVGARTIRLPLPYDVSAEPAELLPWVRTVSGHMGLPIELVGDAVCSAWDELGL